MTLVVEVASTPDRDGLVAEIWWDNQMIAEVRKSGDGDLYVDLYPSPSRVPWSFRLDDFMRAMKEAERRLR